MNQIGVSGDKETPNASNESGSRCSDNDPTKAPKENENVSYDSINSQLSKFPVGSDENNLEILKKIETRRKINWSKINGEERDPAVCKLIQIGGKVGLSDEGIGRSIKILDFNLYQDPEIQQQIDLLIIASLLMSIKLDDFKPPEMWSLINFGNFEESEILSFELKVFQNLNYDVIFATPSHFLCHQLKLLDPEKIPQFEFVSHYSRVICVCAQSSIKCCEFSGEEIAAESLKIAMDFVQNSKSFEDLIQSKGNEIHNRILEAMSKLNKLIPSGIFNGIIELAQKEKSQ